MSLRYLAITLFFFAGFENVFSTTKGDYFETGYKKQLSAGININSYTQGNFRAQSYGFYTIHFLLLKEPGTFHRMGMSFNKYSFVNDQSNTTSFSLIGKYGREYILYNKSQKLKLSAGADLCLAYFKNKVSYPGLEHGNIYTWLGPGINPFFSATWYPVKRTGINMEFALPLYYLLNGSVTSGGGVNQRSPLGNGILWVDRVATIQLAYRF